jgi:hypothetical protein
MSAPVDYAAAIARCPARAFVSCSCGRHVLEDLDQALAELARPCPDCRRRESRALERCGSESRELAAAGGGA